LLQVEDGILEFSIPLDTV